MSDIRRILVVEDEAIEAMALQARLENLGYAVVDVVDSGEEAIERAADLSPDLILMDIRLAGDMDGIEAAQQIRIRFDIPVVYLTAYADQATLGRAKITGPFGYLHKPVEERALQTTVEVALYKHGMEWMLKVLAHKVNNRLAIIQAFAELLEDELEGSPRNDALTIFEEVQHATRLLRDLLPVEGKRPSSKAEVIANKILHRALRLKAPGFRVNHIEVQLDLAADVPEVMADEIQLCDVFINILTNAQDAMAEAKGGGNLRIQGRLVDGKVKLSFADDGLGISKDNLDKIFERGFTMRAADGGKGLGLFVSRAILREHGGELWAESDPGKGATFHLELPGLHLPVNPEVAGTRRLK